MSLGTLKKRAPTNIDVLNEKIGAILNPFKAEADARFWQPTVDKAGNGYAVVRFVPQETEEEDAVDFVRVYDHGFKGPGGWYIENNRTTLGKDEPDPVSEYNSELWNSEVEANQDIVRGKGGTAGTKRRTHFFANVLVLEDPGKPENVGKVFIYKFGKKIFEKIDNKMKPKFADQAKINPFDLNKGANFKIRIQKVDGQRNYNESSFDEPTALDKKYENLTSYSLAEFIAPKNFKTYAELKARLNRVLGVKGSSVVVPETSQATPATASAPKVKGTPVPDDDDSPPFDTAGDDELERFRQMVSVG